MKEIVFDVSTLGAPVISGVGVYVQSLFTELQKLEQSQSEWRLDPILKWSRFKKRSYVKTHLNHSPQLFLPILNSRNGQIFHGPDFQVLSGVRGPKVVTIHDLAFYEEGMTSLEFAQRKINQIERLIKHQKPDAYLTVSHYTKQKLIERFPEIEDRVFVTHLGHEHLLVDPVSEPEFEKKNSFFLFVGNLEARKNVSRLLKAFDLYCEKQKHGTDLILIGRPGYGYQEIQDVYQGLKYKDRVQFLGHVSNRELKSYYRHALAFVYPSIIEGFGLPLVEAMLERCPILTADQTSTKEVAGNAAILVNPYDIQSIEAGMVQLATRSDLRQQLIELGNKRVSEFTWNQCAQKTLQVYKRFF